ncbi:cupin domain-containing protein [Halomicroarcula sp. GCM10025817]|uniref:cupin domain-containing protein n=1 Tax=Haloarcula TaxID=2237 RepID=UPI0023E87C95|nr:cupin domain-containing protein [Halomicroarcula sp. SYNS111]
MKSTRVGRTLDRNGEPIPGSGFEVDPDSVLAETLRERTGPLVSNPVSQEWVAELERPEDTGGTYHSALYLSAGEGPPEHYHVGYDETFEGIAGELTVVIDGRPHRVSPGDSRTVPAGRVHKPRYDGDSFAAAIGTVEPPGKTLPLIKTLFGLAHDGLVSDAGQPKFLQGMVWTDELADDTVFTSPPPAVAHPLATVLAPIGRRVGYRVTYPKYEDPAFWELHVEQPPF